MTYCVLQIGKKLVFLMTVNKNFLLKMNLSILDNYRTGKKLVCRKEFIYYLILTYASYIKNRIKIVSSKCGEEFQRNISFCICRKTFFAVSINFE